MESDSPRLAGSHMLRDIVSLYSLPVCQISADRDATSLPGHTKEPNGPPAIADDTVSTEFLTTLAACRRDPCIIKVYFCPISHYACISKRSGGKCPKATSKSPAFPMEPHSTPQEDARHALKSANQEGAPCGSRARYRPKDADRARQPAKEPHRPRGASKTGGASGSNRRRPLGTSATRRPAIRPAAKAPMPSRRKPSRLPSACPRPRSAYSTSW